MSHIFVFDHSDFDLAFAGDDPEEQRSAWLRRRSTLQLRAFSLTLLGRPLGRRALDRRAWRSSKTDGERLRRSPCVTCLCTGLMFLIALSAPTPILAPRGEGCAQAPRGLGPKPLRRMFWGCRDTQYPSHKMASDAFVSTIFVCANPTAHAEDSYSSAR